MSLDSKSSFFRQSGWMVVSTFTGGLFMTLVHTVAKRMGDQEYSSFVSLLRVLIIMGIPAAALQTVFAQQAAAAVHEKEERELSNTIRVVFAFTFLIWLVMAGVIAVEAGTISRLLKVTNDYALLFTVLVGLTSLGVPILKGVLQGRHQFAGFGFMMVLDGLGRFFMVVVLVLAFHFKAAGAMFAAFLGQTATALIGAWLTRDVWRRRESGLVDWKAWLRRVIPLTLGLGTLLLMQSADMLFVQGLLSSKSDTALYGGAMLTGFAILQFIAPVTLVMFPRIVRSVARAERTDTLGMTLAATASFGCVAAIGCTILPWLPLRLMYFSNPEMWKAAPLVPWFAWALLPLSVANVLVQNLLARKQFQAVSFLVLVCAGYCATLMLQSPSLVAMKSFDAFERVIQTLGLYSLLLCAVAAWFTWRKPVAAAATK